MKIERLRIQNFRCFGNEVQDFDLDDLTAFIGGNGSGKTAVLLALSRLFGVTQSERSLQLDDFHYSPNSNEATIDRVELMIEARIWFPELLFKNENDCCIPPCFNQMIVEGENRDPYCRIRLEGVWTRNGLPDGDIEEKLFWITTASEDVKDEHKRPMHSYERSLIQVIYVPASRDASKLLRNASGSLVYRLLRAIEWSGNLKNSVENSAKTIREAMQAEPSVNYLHTCLGNAWRKLHDMPALRNVSFQTVSGALDDLLKQVEAQFSPGAGGREHSVEMLSDGLKSLFYFSLVASVFEIEQAVKDKQLKPRSTIDGAVRAEPDALAAFNVERLQAPGLTIFAVEEPENHLAPHYLGRIIEVLTTIADSNSGQVLMTSHSPSIMARLEPTNVRYLRLVPVTLDSQVRRITLPVGDAEALKYVKEAVRAFPELYFARLVILGEGDSEEIVIPRVAKALDTPIDTNLIAVVPLGGRHVNHFWKLLRDLDIPHITLLDLDRERHGGGWGRIQYACSQLIANGVLKETLLSVRKETGEINVLSEDEFEKMKTWPSYDEELVGGWLRRLERHGVFFAAPLDLDFLMLRAFPTAYHESCSGIPHMPYDKNALKERVDRAISAVLKEGGSDGTTYSDDEKREFIWYSYLFLGKGKPTTHLLSLNRIKSETLAANAPPVLMRLCKAVSTHLPSRA